jgi:hypothetical protein
MKLKASDFALILKLADRGVDLGNKFGGCYTRGVLSVPLMECHAVIPLDLKRLASFPDSDFAHDIFGIQRHFRYGKMQDCFLPRCAKL